MATHKGKQVKTDGSTMSGSIIPDKLSNVTINNFRNTLLEWYDNNRRALPWRALPDEKTNPYHVWLSEIMLQQTVVAAVVPYFLKFKKKWPRVHDLAQAPVDDVMKEWAGLGYYARARNLHKGAQYISTELNGIFPQEEMALKAIPGVGDYTAAAILSIGFNKPSVVVDGNVERVMARYFAIQTPLPSAKPLIRQAASLMAHNRTDRPSDYAQALMDLGATVCIPKTPRCSLCPLSKRCAARKAGIEASLPLKSAKTSKKTRYGAIYLVEDAITGRYLLEKRPEKGLLGGMMGFPSSEWLASKDITHPEAIISLGKPVIMKGCIVKHSFTHFDLHLQGFKIRTQQDHIKNAKWINKNKLLESGLPSVFQKFALIVGNNIK